MTKRRPFGSFDPNVQRSGDDSVASSVPSVEEALRLKRRTKKSKQGNNGSFLIDSTSKTPRISNRSKQQKQALLPKRGVNKQLRRLEQSMASRAKQAEQTQRANLSENTISNEQNVAASKHVETVTVGSKRKERSADPMDDSTKRLKQTVKETSIVVGGDKAYGSNKTMMGDKDVVSARKVRGDAVIKKQSQLHSSGNEHEHVHVDATKQIGRSEVADKYFEQRHNSDKHSKGFESLPVHDISARNRPEGTELAIESEQVDSQPQVTQEAMMDCTSDDESLQLSPGSSTASPFQENASDVKYRHKERITRFETEEEKRYEEEFPRLSMTTHVDGVVPLRATHTADEDSESLPKSMEELVRQESSGNPLVTKGMLSRARKAKADNEDVVAAMMKSGPPYKGRQERIPSPDASMIGAMIGVHPSGESASLDGSEVTMLTTDSYLTDVRADHKSKKNHAKSNDESGPSPHVKEKKVDQKASPDDVSSVPEANSSRMSKSRGRDSSVKQMKDIREPEEGIDEGSQVIYFEHNGIMIPHPPLPSGWIIRVSQTKQRPFYCHPDHGSTWHCPIVLPQGSSDTILQSIYEPSVVNIPAKDGEELNEDDTESEDSEMWSAHRLRKDVESECAAERQSLSSVTTSSSTGHSQDTTQDSHAKDATKEGKGGRGSSEVSSLASSIVEKDKDGVPANKDTDQQVSSVGNETLTPTGQQRQDDTGKKAFNSIEENHGSATRSHTSTGSKRTVCEPVKKDADGTPIELNEPSPSGHGIARVSLVETEASTEELSPGFVEELVSTSRFRRSNGGAVAKQEIYDGGDDEFVQVDSLPVSTKVSTKFHGNAANDKAFLATFRESHNDTGSLDSVKQRQVVQGADSRSDEGDLPKRNTEVDFVDVGDVDVDVDPEEDEDLEADTHSVGSIAARSNKEQTATPNLSRHTKSPPAAAVETEQILEAIVEHTVSHRAGGGRQVKPVEFEAEVDDVVFGVDHDDLELSPQTERLSPIKHMQSFDNEDERLHVDTTVGSDDETALDDPIETSPPPPPKNDSPIVHEDSPDKEAGDFVPTENSPQTYADADDVPSSKKYSPPEPEDFPVEADDDQLSVASSLTEAESMDGTDDAPPTKWRGYSHRILHPPHPLDSLMNIEALIEAALRRAERQKKAKKKTSKKKKSSRLERRKTSTKLVFE